MLGVGLLSLVEQAILLLVVLWPVTLLAIFAVVWVFKANNQTLMSLFVNHRSETVWFDTRHSLFRLSPDPSIHALISTLAVLCARIPLCVLCRSGPAPDSSPSWQTHRASRRTDASRASPACHHSHTRSSLIRCLWTPSRLLRQSLP